MEKWTIYKIQNVRKNGIKRASDIKHELEPVHYKKLIKLIRYLENKQYISKRGSCRIGKIHLSKKQYEEYLSFNVELVEIADVELVEVGIDYIYGFLEKKFRRIAENYFAFAMPIFVYIDEQFISSL